MKKTAAVSDKNLIRRYLIWCYKTTKEELDRIERKFTQLKVDHALLDSLRRELKSEHENAGIYSKKVDEFVDYMKNKEASAYPSKFADHEHKKLQPNFWYLQKRFTAVEKTIVKFLGSKELKKIEALYEGEMIKRILESREHT